MFAKRCNRARLSPNRIASTIAGRNGAPNERAERLVDAIKAVLNDAIKAGGSSLRDHKMTDGELGMFQHSFRVYGREGERCRTPGCRGTVKRDRAEWPLDLLLSGVPEIIFSSREAGENRMSSQPVAYDNIIVETRGKVGLIRLNRPAGAQRAQPRAGARSRRKRSTHSRRTPPSAAW